MKSKKPKVGDDIYVETHLYIGHPLDDVIGGLAQIRNVHDGISAGEKTVFVEVLEHPGSSYNWSQCLSTQQEELKKKFGSERAYPDPDHNVYE